MDDDDKFDDNNILIPLDPLSGRKGIGSGSSDYSPAPRRETGKFSVLMMPTSSAREQETKLAEKEEKENDQATRNAFGSLKKKKDENDKGADKKAEPQDSKKKIEPGKKKEPGKDAEKRSAFGQSKGKDAGNPVDGYRAAYAKRQRELEDAKHERNLTPEQKLKKIYEQKKIEREETNNRVRAKDLMDQKIWWQQQLGTGFYDDNYIYGIIAGLDQELGAIDVRFWP